MKAMFRNGATLKLLLDYFNQQTEIPYKKLALLLDQRIVKYS